MAPTGRTELPLDTPVPRADQPLPPPPAKKLERGKLVVVALEARNLPDKHTFSKQDPYVKLSVTHGGGEEKSQPAHRGGQSPEWNHEARFTVYSVNDAVSELVVEVYAKETSKDDFLGKGKVAINLNWPNDQYDEWLSLEDEAGKYSGEVFLEMTLYKPLTAPTELKRHKSTWVPSAQRQDANQGPPSAPNGAPLSGGNGRGRGIMGMMGRAGGPAPGPAGRGQPVPGPGPAGRGAAPAARGRGYALHDRPMPVRQQEPAPIRTSSLERDQGPGSGRDDYDYSKPTRFGAGLPLPGEPEPEPLPSFLRVSKPQGQSKGDLYDEALNMAKPPPKRAESPIEAPSFNPQPIGRSSPAPRPTSFVPDPRVGTPMWPPMHGAAQPAFPPHMPPISTPLYPPQSFTPGFPPGFIPGQFPASMVTSPSMTQGVTAPYVSTASPGFFPPTTVGSPFMGGQPQHPGGLPQPSATPYPPSSTPVPQPGFPPQMPPQGWAPPPPSATPAQMQPPQAHPQVNVVQPTPPSVQSPPPQPAQQQQQQPQFFQGGQQAHQIHHAHSNSSPVAVNFQPVHPPQGGQQAPPQQVTSPVQQPVQRIPSPAGQPQQQQQYHPQQQWQQVQDQRAPSPAQTWQAQQQQQQRTQSPQQWQGQVQSAQPQVQAPTPPPGQQQQQYQPAPPQQQQAPPPATPTHHTSSSQESLPHQNHLVPGPRYGAPSTPEQEHTSARSSMISESGSFDSRSSSPDSHPEKWLDRPTSTGQSRRPSGQQDSPQTSPVSPYSPVAPVAPLNIHKQHPSQSSIQVSIPVEQQAPPRPSSTSTTVVPSPQTARPITPTPAERQSTPVAPSPVAPQQAPITFARPTEDARFAPSSQKAATAKVAAVTSGGTSPSTSQPTPAMSKAQQQQLRLEAIIAQERKDALLAAQMAENDGDEYETYQSARKTREQEDAEFAASLAEQDEDDRTRREREDEELALKLAEADME